MDECCDGRRCSRSRSAGHEVRLGAAWRVLRIFCGGGRVADVVVCAVGRGLGVEDACLCGWGGGGGCCGGGVGVWQLAVGCGFSWGAGCLDRAGSRLGGER